MSVKVTLAGEIFEYDGSKTPMSEALAIEHVYKRRYVEWQSDLEAGSARAMCVLAWVIWRRDGRDVPFEDIIEGRADFDLMEMLNSLAESVEAAARAAAEAEAEEAAGPVPTPAGSAPAGTATTGTLTSASSPKSSGTRRRK